MTRSAFTSLATLLGLVLMLVASINAQGLNNRNNTNRNSCRRGLCPYVKKLVPDLTSHPALSHYSPVVHGSEPPSLCGNLCIHDFQCPNQQKCCPTNCGYACFDAVFVADNEFHLVQKHDSYHSTHGTNHHNTHHDTHHPSSYHP